MVVSLSMPLFVAVKDCILRMQLDSTLAGINDIVASGIIGAQLYVQRVLNSKFQKQSYDCMYYTDVEAFSGVQPDGLFRLELPSGFVRKDVSVDISASEASCNVQITGPFGTFDTVDSGKVKVDYNRGYVLISKEYSSRYIRIKCTTGFEDGTTPLPTTDINPYNDQLAYAVGDKVVYNEVVWRCIHATTAGIAPGNLVYWELVFVPMEQIPVEVYDSIISMVPVIFDNSQTTNRNDEAEKQYKKSAEHAATLLQPWVRIKGFSFRPIWSE